MVCDVGGGTCVRESPGRNVVGIVFKLKVREAELTSVDRGNDAINLFWLQFLLEDRLGSLSLGLTLVFGLSRDMVSDLPKVKQNLVLISDDTLGVRLGFPDRLLGCMATFGDARHGAGAAGHANEILVVIVFGQARLAGRLIALG